MSKSTVYGVGINDANYKVQPTIMGIRTKCKYYVDWQSLLQRCYSLKYREKQPTYASIEVCDSWKYFSNFKEWAVKEEKEFNISISNYHLDKDIISPSKVYSPVTCAYVSQSLNNLLTDRSNFRGSNPIGVYCTRGGLTYEAHLSISGKRTYLGNFKTTLEAHQAWQRKKIEIILTASFDEVNPKIVSGLQRIANNIQNDLTNNRITERVNA